MFLEPLLENKLKERFGNDNFNSLTIFLQTLGKSDPLLSSELETYAETFLLLKEDEFNKIIKFVNDLLLINYFAAAFFIEKISLMQFYDILDEMILLLSKIKTYSSRNLAYLLGSSTLKSDDLEDVLIEIDINFYKLLLKKVIENSEKLTMLCGPILREARKLYKTFKNKELDEFLEFMSIINIKYGYDVALEVINNIDVINSKYIHSAFLRILKQFDKNNTELLKLIAKYPGKIIKRPQKNLDNIQQIKYLILKNDDVTKISYYTKIMEDRYFSAVVLNWGKYNNTLKSNMLSQLQVDNFKKYFQQNRKIIKKIKLYNKVTDNNWFSNWIFANKVVDNKYIYGKINETLIPNSYYKFLRRKIFASNRELFQSLQKNPQTKDLEKLINYLLNICINKKITVTLTNFLKMINGSNESIMEHFSKDDIVLKVWERNPWVDYARSDELYACTSIGDYADFFAPSYLADSNMTNLDIWNNNNRIGRIHLCILKNNMLLVDSVEGSERLLRNEKRLNIILNSLVKYAEYLKQDAVIINANLTFNNTPKKFIRFLHEKYGDPKKYIVERLIENGTVREILPYPINTFLESLKLKNRGIINGYLIGTRNSMDRVLAI